MVTDKLMAVYEKYGTKAIYPFLYLFFVLINIIGGIGMAYPATYPNEYAVIAMSDYFLGKSWAGVMASVDYYYGFLQSILYVPVVLLFSDPQAQYAAMIVLNSLLISFIPLIAFSLAEKMNVARTWKCLVIALTSGGFCCYFAHSKFAWTETVTILLPWVIIWLVFRAEKIKSRAGRFFYSLLIGALCGLSFAAHTRLITVTAALVLALVLHRIFFGKKHVSLVAFFIALTVVTGCVIMLSQRLQRELWLCDDPSLLKNTLAEFFVHLPERLADGGAYRLIQTLSAQLYYFFTATWGLGAVSFCLFAAVISACVRHKHRKEAQTYEADISLFSFFTTFSVLFMIAFGTLYRFSSDGITVYQDTMMYGRFMDGLIPFAMVFVLIMLFTHSISVNKILGACAVLGIVYITFMSCAVPVILSCTTTRISPVLGLYPLRVGRASRVLLDNESFMLTISMTFCVMGALIVIVSCTKKYRSVIISLIMSALTIYSLTFISLIYLPICHAQSKDMTSSVAELSGFVFDQAGAPTVTAFNISRQDALMLQFLNRNVTVRVTFDIENVPENSFLAVSKDEDVSALAQSRTPFLLVGESSTLRLYAYGERAAAYMRSQNIDESELEAQQDVLVPEKTTTHIVLPETEPSETEPPVTTAATERTTERTPVFSTVRVPDVITTPADVLDPDDEWAVID